MQPGADAHLLATVPGAAAAVLPAAQAGGAAAPVPGDLQRGPPGHPAAAAARPARGADGVANSAASDGDVWSAASANKSLPIMQRRLKKLCTVM